MRLYRVADFSQPVEHPVFLAAIYQDLHTVSKKEFVKGDISMMLALKAMFVGCALRTIGLMRLICPALLFLTWDGSARYKVDRMPDQLVRGAHPTVFLQVSL